MTGALPGAEIPAAGPIATETVKAQWHWRLLLWTLGLAPAFSSIFWPRQAFEVPPPWDAWNRLLLADDMWLALLFGRGCTAAVLLIEFWVVWHCLPRQGMDRRGYLLWLFGLGCSASFFLSAAFGTVPWFPIGIFGLPLMLCAVFWLPTPTMSWLSREVCRVCLFHIIASLALAVPAFGWIVESPYDQGYLPWLTFRLHGLAVSQGGLGLFVIVFLAVRILADDRPWTRRTYGSAALALMVALLAQSKISWFFILVLLGFAGIRRWADRSGGLASPTVSAILLWSLGGACCLLWLLSPLAASGLWADGNERLTTVTGRTEVWEICVELWRQSPFFGYGNDLWSPSMAALYEDRIGWLPTHSHNQAFQSLAQTGFVGCAFFLLYSCAFLRYGLKASRATHGCSLFLAAFLLARCFTESWLGTVVNNGMLFFHGASLAIIVVGLRQDPQRVDPTLAMPPA